MNKKTLVKDGFCFVCGNKGFIDKDCPSCGREATIKSMNLEFSDDAESYVTQTGMCIIPDHYKGIFWNGEVLRSSKGIKENNYHFNEFLNGLESINSVFARGILSRMSAIIIAPAGYSKLTFAYSCMQRAVSSGFSVAPLLDTVELKRVLTLAGDNPNYCVGGTLNYDSYINSEVLFITVTKLPARAWAFEVIQELIDRRARKGLSTFIISRYSLNEMMYRDASNEFKSLFQSHSEDRCKYPAVITYSE